MIVRAAYKAPMRDAIELAVQIVSGVLLSSFVLAAIGIAWFAIESTP
jgi:hypothetical protein